MAIAVRFRILHLILMALAFGLAQLAAAFAENPGNDAALIRYTPFQRVEQASMEKAYSLITIEATEPKAASGSVKLVRDGNRLSLRPTAPVYAPEDRHIAGTDED